MKTDIRTDEGLPFASSARVTSEGVVGLQTNLSVQRRLDFTLVSTRAGEDRSTKLSLNEELGVEFAGGRVEGSSGDGGINEIGSSDGV